MHFLVVLYLFIMGVSMCVFCVFSFVQSISISNYDWQFGDHTVNEVGFSKVLKAHILTKSSIQTWMYIQTYTHSNVYANMYTCMCGF